MGRPTAPIPVTPNPGQRVDRSAEDRTVHVSLEDAETALRIARAVSQAGGPDGAQLEVAWLLGLFGASFAPADLGRVADALRLAGLACEPEIAAAPPDGRVTVVLFARRFADEPAPEPAPASTAPSAEEADQGVRRTAVLLAAAALPVLATVTLGSTVGVVFLVLAVGGIGAARLRTRAPDPCRRGRGRPGSGGTGARGGGGDDGRGGAAGLPGPGRPRPAHGAGAPRGRGGGGGRRDRA